MSLKSEHSSHPTTGIKQVDQITLGQGPEKSEDEGARVGGGRRRAAVRRAIESAAAAVLDDGGGCGACVVVDAVVGGDDVAGVVAVPLHPLLHAAALRRAAVVVPAREHMGVPWIWATLDSLLAILPPFESIVQDLHL
uniref:Uncharacterized protein n=1 Tax=Zea mays TaxID=4577 RepID=A0A804UBA0_MAIZE